MPIGKVTFLDGHKKLGSATLNASGQATFKTSTLRRGAHNITARYHGDDNYRSSTSAVLTQTVNP